MNIKRTHIERIEIECLLSEGREKPSEYLIKNGYDVLLDVVYSETMKVCAVGEKVIR